MSDIEMLARFVDAFEKLDDMLSCEAVPSELATGGGDGELTVRTWKPAPINTPATALESFYRQIPHSLPPVYEQLILTYRWLEVDLGSVVRLLPNPPGPDLTTLGDEICRDSAFVEVLFPLGLIPFGKAPDGCYDPVCFDTRRRHANGDCQVIRVEHESVLCHLQLGDTWPVTSSFRNLMRSVIAEADGIDSS